MSFNRNILYAPSGDKSVLRFDLEDPSSPVALSSLDLAAGLQLVSLALFSDGDVVVLDTAERKLIRISPAGAEDWNVVASSEAEAVPKMVVVDENDDVWVAFEGEKISKFDGTNGNLLGRVDDTEESTVIQASDASFIVAYRPDTGQVTLIDVVSRSIAHQFDIADKTSEYAPNAERPVVQIGMIGTKYFIPARKIADNKYSILEFSEENLLQVLPIEWSRAITGTLTDDAGYIYGMEEFSNVFRFQPDKSLDAIYSVESQGRINGLALDDTAGVLFVLTDDHLGESRLHNVDPSVGVATYLAHAGGPVSAGDYTGFQLAKVISEPDVPLAPPVITGGKITGWDFTGVEAVITGRVGAVSGATDVTSSLGNANIEDDGSFVIRGASTTGLVTLTFNGPGGSTPEDVTIVTYTATAQAGSKLFGTKFGTDGGYIKAFLVDGSGDPLTTGNHYIRILDHVTGKYFNGTNLVVSNGLFIALVHVENGLWAYNFEPSAIGDYTVFFEEGTVYSHQSIQVTEEKQNIESILAKVDALAEPGAALQAPTNLFQDPNEIGGFLVHAYNRLQHLLNLLQSKASFVFPKSVQGIAVLTTPTYVKTGDTPLITFTVLDATTDEPKDLTGHVVWLNVRTQPAGNQIIRRQLTLIDAENGGAEIKLTSSDTAVSGTFLAELEDIAPDGTILSSESWKLTINPDLT